MNTALSFSMKCCYRNKQAILTYFSLEVDTKILIFFIYLSYFHLRNTIRNNSYIIILFQQTLRDIILLFHDIAGLDLNLEEWKEVCR